MDHLVRVEQLDPHPLAVVRRRARSEQLSKVVPECCGIVWGVVRAQQLKGAGRNVALYRDCRDGLIDLEVGVELDTPFAGQGEVIASTTPSGPAATTTHLGPYGRLHLAHDAILAWCRDHGQTLAGPSWEVYGHWKEEWNSDPSLIRTDVFYLLKAGTARAREAPATITCS